MPTLVRLLTVLAMIALAVFAGMAALIYLVDPAPRRVVIEVPLDLSAPADTAAVDSAASQP